MARRKQSLSERVEKVDSESGKQVAAAGQPSTLAGQVERVKLKPKNYLLDLRIHSPASLGYLGIEGIDTAPALVRLAQVKGLDVIAITDYHSGAYIDRILEAAQTSDVKVIPGTVLRCALESCDDVILSCLFPENYGTSKIQEFLAALGVPPSAAGNRDFLVRKPFAQILETVDQYNGVVLPSRMDKTPHRMSVIPVLVERYGFRAFDLAYSDSLRFFKTRWPKIKFQLFSFSNANALAQVGSRTAKVKLEDPGFSGIRDLIGREAR